MATVKHTFGSLLLGQQLLLRAQRICRRVGSLVIILRGQLRVEGKEVAARNLCTLGGVGYEFDRL